MYNDGVSCDAWQYQAIQLRRMKLFDSIFSFKNKEDVGSTDLANSTFIKPEDLGEAFCSSFQRCEDGWSVIAEYDLSYLPILKHPAPLGADLIFSV